MNRIAQAFSNKAKVAYLTAGDGDSLARFTALVKQGANVLEIGIPFSDPIADGPIIQAAMLRALGTTVDDVLALIRNLRAKVDAALIVFTYLNPIQADLLGFLQKAKEAGADGILVVDLPFDESYEFRQSCKKAGLAPIFVIAPSTPLERIKKIGKAGEGFLYYACRKGTTGERTALPDDLEEKIALIRSVSKLPIAVGFGISSKEAVKEVLEIADGVVVGSYFVANPEPIRIKIFEEI